MYCICLPRLLWLPYWSVAPRLVFKNGTWQNSVASSIHSSLKSSRSTSISLRASTPSIERHGANHPQGRLSATRQQTRRALHPASPAQHLVAGNAAAPICCYLHCQSGVIRAGRTEVYKPKRQRANLLAYSVCRAQSFPRTVCLISSSTG